MATITLGLGTSHTPMLLVDASGLPRYEENDRRLSLLDNDGTPVAFDTLLAARAGHNPPDVTPRQLAARHAAAQQAIARLSDAMGSAKLDALIVIGDDQKEMLRGEPAPPPLLIYDRPTIRRQRSPHPPGRPAWVLRGSDRYYPAESPRDYPVAQALARHISRHLSTHGLTVADLAGEDAPMGHAFAFVHAQIMPDPPVPVVPVLLNALYPPDQPTPKQSWRSATPSPEPLPRLRTTSASVSLHPAALATSLSTRHLTARSCAP